MADKKQSNQDSAANSLLIIDMAIPLKGGLNKGHTFSVGIPLPILWILYSATRETGPKTMVDILHMTYLLTNKATEQNIPDPFAAAITTWIELTKTFAGDPEEAIKESVMLPAEEEYVLGFTYMLLRSKVITHKTAARIATALLRSENAISPDAWRTKIERWRKNNKLPKVGQRNRKPNKQR